MIEQQVAIKMSMPAKRNLVCDERERLLETYHQAVSAYAQVVSELKIAGREAFARKFAMADAARDKCDRLCEEIAHHRTSHGC